MLMIMTFWKEMLPIGNLKSRWRN